MSPAAKKSDKTDALSTDLSVGEILRRARLSSDQTFDEIEENIRIRAPLLEAIEAMDFDRLPGWTYTIGFIRSYAEYLDLDGDKMISLLKDQVGEQKRQELNFPVTVSESSMPDLWVITMAGVGLLVLIAATFMLQSFFPNREVNEIPPIERVLKSVKDLPVSTPSTAEENIENTTDQASVDQAIEEEAPPQQNSEQNFVESTPEEDQNISEEMTDEQEEIVENAPRDDEGLILPVRKPRPPVIPQQQRLEERYRVIMRVVDDSWVEIRNAEGEEVVSRQLKAGDIFYVPNNAEGFTMTTSNVAGIRFTVDGQALRLAGRRGGIRQNIPLDAESLREMGR